MPRVMAEQEVGMALEQSTLPGQTVDGVRVGRATRRMRSQECSLTTTRMGGGGGGIYMGISLT